jgi:V/A-type H+-transporting ATPase subunit K
MLIHTLILVSLVAAWLLWAGRKLPAPALMRAITGGLVALNSLVVILALGTALLLWLESPVPAQAGPILQEDAQESEAQADEGGLSGSTALGASLATGLAAIGAGIAVGISGAAAIGAITEKPEVLGRSLIFVGLAEGIAIYGLIISFMILIGGLG